MGKLFKKSLITENRIDNAGRWPVRVTHFELLDEYEFPATNFPEIFFVQQGTFLHDTDVGTQAVREGTVAVVNPGYRHVVKNPEEVVLTRVRYLPEWLTGEYPIIANSPKVLTLFFDQSWFHCPREESLHVFSTRDEGTVRIREEIDYLRALLREKRHFEPIARVSLLKLMMLLADEHDRFWRGVSEVEIRPEAKHALDRIEATVLAAAPFEASKMARGGYQKKAIDEAFDELAGMSLLDYSRRRRVFHAAARLLSSADEPRKVSKEVGFPTVGEFRKDFEEVFDISPEIYREKFGIVAEQGAPAKGAEEGA